MKSKGNIIFCIAFSIYLATMIFTASMFGNMQVFSCVETGKMWCLCFAIMENSDGKPVFIRTNSKIWNWCWRSIDRILLFQVYMGSIFILVSVSMCRCVLSGYIENISLDQWNRDCNCGNVQRMGTDTCQKQYYGRETAICHRL